MPTLWGKNDTFYKWVIGGLLILLKIFDSLSAPISTIQTPCGGLVTVTEINRKTSQETISQLHILLNEAKSQAETSKFEIVKSIGNSAMVTLLENYTCFQIINADENKADVDIKADLGKLFNISFVKFSKLTIYIGFAASDDDGNHVGDFKAVLNMLWSILCELQIGILSQGESTTPYLNTSIISDQVRLLCSSELKLFRNYTIIRDLHKILEQFILLYKDISV